MSENVIETKDLTKRYGFFLWKKKVPALDHLTISIPRGAVYGFLGPNGAGKTTTLKLLMDLIKPTEGTATILGASVSDVEIKKFVGFLPDTPSFSGQMSAQEFLGICAQLLKIPHRDRKKRVSEVLETVQMEKHAKGKLASFSRGMLQRIGIAQAILNKPKLLILDEPLLGLDPYGRQDLKNIIQSQNKQGTTVFFSSHILSDVQEICNHIAILNKGHLLRNGKISDLLNSTGERFRIKGHDSDAMALLPRARSSSKNPDGTWDLEFDTPEGALAEDLTALEKRLGADMVREAICGSLEDYFFKVIEENNNEIIKKQE